MNFPLLPAVLADSLTDITQEFLKSRDIRLLMLDFDNTIVPYTTSTPTAEMEAWLTRMLSSEISVCVVSNSKKPRVREFCGKRNIPCITHSRKPFSKGIRQCLVKFGIEAQYAALVGDQIFTDTLGANCAGLQSVLVRAINNHNFWLKLRHVAELPFVFLARKRKLPGKDGKK